MINFVFIIFLFVALFVVYGISLVTKRKKDRGEISPEESKRTQIICLIVMVVMFIIVNLKFLLM